MGERPFAPKREGKTLYNGRYFANFYTNDTNGHDMILLLRRVKKIGGDDSMAEMQGECHDCEVLHLFCK